MAALARVDVAASPRIAAELDREPATLCQQEEMTPMGGCRRTCTWRGRPSAAAITFLPSRPEQRRRASRGGSCAPRPESRACGGRQKNKEKSPIDIDASSRGNLPVRPRAAGRAPPAPIDKTPARALCTPSSLAAC
jgi:hypothetical protein